MFLVCIFNLEIICLEQWFLTWVRSNPRGSVSQSQGFGGGQDTHPTHMIRDDTPRFAVNIHYYVLFLCENHVLKRHCQDLSAQVRMLVRSRRVTLRAQTYIGTPRTAQWRFMTIERVLVHQTRLLTKEQWLFRYADNGTFR